MTKSPSSNNDELPLFRVLGIETPSDTAAQLDYIKRFLGSCVSSYRARSLDKKSRLVLEDIATMLELGVDYESAKAEGENDNG